MSRIGRGFRGASQRMRFQSSFKPSMSSNYTRYASASPFAQPTSKPTITATYSPVYCTMTPTFLTMPTPKFRLHCFHLYLYRSLNVEISGNIIVCWLHSLTDTMEAGSHLIGTGTSSSALAGNVLFEREYVSLIEISRNYQSALLSSNIPVFYPFTVSNPPTNSNRNPNWYLDRSRHPSNLPPPISINSVMSRGGRGGRWSVTVYIMCPSIMRERSFLCFFRTNVCLLSPRIPLNWLTAMLLTEQHNHSTLSLCTCPPPTSYWI